MPVSNSKKGKKAHRVKHKIWKLICAVKKDTNVVKQDLINMGISDQKLRRWRSDEYSFVGPEDQIKLKNYLTRYPETEVNSIDDIFDMIGPQDVLSTKKP